MIRLTEETMGEIQKRGCSPLESLVFGLRLQMWPLFQKSMTEQIDGLRKLAEGTSTGYFRRAVATTDQIVSLVRYPLLSLRSVLKCLCRYASVIL